MSIEITEADAIKFLEGAVRNWSRVPRLSHDDLNDVRVELERFISRIATLQAREDVEPVCSEPLERAAHVKPIVDKWAPLDGIVIDGKILNDADIAAVRHIALNVGMAAFAIAAKKG